MTDSFLVKIFEHNNWANEMIIHACMPLTDEQLDAEPHSVTKGNIRETLMHLVSSQAGYLLLLTRPMKERNYATLQFSDLLESAQKSGQGLLALASGEQQPYAAQLETRDGYHTQPWVVMLQIINHATEHREQIKSMLSALGITPPDMDGWDYGLATRSLVPMA